MRFDLVPVADLGDAQVSEMTNLVNLANRDRRGVFPGDRLDPNTLRDRYPNDTAVLGRSNALLIACGTLRPEEDAVWIFLLAVHPDHRGQSLGERMIAEAQEMAEKLALPWLKLQAVDRGSLVNYYLRLGFEEHHRELKPPGTWRALAPFDLVDLRLKVK